MDFAVTGYSETFNCGVIRGGTTINTVAESCEVLIDIRSMTLRGLEGVEAAVGRIAQAPGDARMAVTVERISLCPSMEHSPDSHRLLQGINRAGAAWG